MKTRKIVTVRWQDSCGRGRWVTEEDAKKYEPEVITSAGLQVHRTRHKIVLAISVDKDSGVSDTLTIPRGCVKEIKEIGKLKIC